MSDNPVTQAPVKYKYVMTRNEFDDMTTFVQQVGYELVFGLNAGPGPRDENSISIWNSTNAQELLNYAKNVPSILGFELGNEPNLFFLSFGPKYFLQPNELATAFSQLQQLVSLHNQSNVC